MTLKEGDEQTTSSLYDDFHLVPVCVGAIELEEAIVLLFVLPQTDDKNRCALLGCKTVKLRNFTKCSFCDFSKSSVDFVVVKH